MSMLKPTNQAVDLLVDASMALAQVESNGIRIDTDRLKEVKIELGDEISKLEKRLYRSKWWSIWEKEYKASANLRSNDQLKTLLFDKLGYKPQNFTATGRPSVSSADLENINHPFIAKYRALKKLMKIRDTYISALEREVVDGYLHPVFNLHNIDTFRSSSSNPNFQNVPVRDKQTSKYIRSLFIPRPNHLLLEIDYSAVEVRVAACYHKDPAMLSYIREGKDLHADMAIECYKLQPEQLSKAARVSAKGGFVFPAFYGSYYQQIAPAMWETISTDDIRTQQDVPMREHLKSVGIRNLSDFTQHIRQVENDFWNIRFPVYDQWKKDLWEKYQKTGELMMLSGFPYRGDRKRNECINAPVQGAAFHCLLWSLMKLQQWLNEAGMKSLIIGQIHDSIVWDVHEDELDLVLKKAKEVMTKDVVDHYKWLIVPLDIEAEGSRKNWYEKEEIEI